MQRKKKISEKELSEQIERLKEMFADDIPVFLANRRASLSEVASVQLRESGINDYMADVITNDKGKVVEVRFDRIKNR